MGEEATAVVTLPPSLLPNGPNSSSSSLRFLGLLKRPKPDLGTAHFLPLGELEESDVVWSSAAPATASDLSSAAAAPSFDAGDRRLSLPYRRPDRPFSPESRGLSAALAEDGHPLVRPHRPAARIAHPVPVPAARPSPAEAGKGFHQSAPVNVPAWPRGQQRRRSTPLEDWEEGEDRNEGEVEEEEEEEEMVPPHVIVARSHEMTFSVFEGVGRTLKGRDLRRVRNAVLQKTGFLDL